MGSEIVPPKVIRGELPPRMHPWHWRSKIPSPFIPHRELALAIPPVRDAQGKPQGGWVLCAEEKTRGVGPKERRKRMVTTRDRLRRFFEREHPLEDWEIRYLTVEGTACDLELYCRFLGILTEEEHELRMKKRKEHYEEMMRRRDELAAERALQSRSQKGGPK